jgi:hypothetical protein
MGEGAHHNLEPTLLTIGVNYFLMAGASLANKIGAPWKTNGCKKRSVNNYSEM